VGYDLVICRHRVAGCLTASTDSSHLIQNKLDRLAAPHLVTVGRYPSRGRAM
jgi:hypothetical protein